MSLLIKNVLLSGEKTDIFIEKNIIKKIGRNLNLKADEKIDGKGEKAVLPGLINCHTHAAMALFRGYADDLPLDTWLKEKIWPLEAKLTPEDVYWGTKLACLEMIKSGTTTFNEMYWFGEAQIEAAKEMGLRGKIGLILLDFLPRGNKEHVEKLFEKLKKKLAGAVSLSISPHAIYSVSRENLIWAQKFARKNKLILHSHLSETEEEVKNCQKKWKMRPVEYLEKIGFLGKDTVLAHGIWLSDKEINILRKRKCSLVYNPCSNLKLAVGGIFSYKKLKENKINICLGTDGPASNNNLDLFGEMKIGSLVQKYREKDPTIAKAKEVFNWPTKNGAKALGINAGEIKRGKLADLILINLNKIYFIPGHNFISDIVYSAFGDCVSDLICHGKVLMRNGEFKGEREIIEKSKNIARKLVKEDKSSFPPFAAARVVKR